MIEAPLHVGPDERCCVPFSHHLQGLRSSCEGNIGPGAATGVQLLMRLDVILRRESCETRAFFAHISIMFQATVRTWAFFGALGRTTRVMADN